MSDRLPLSRIRVLDLTLIWAGPAAVMLLADLGAEIIRVESCQHHITNTRGYVPRPAKDLLPHLGYLGALYADSDPKEDPWNRHGMFNSLGRNKRSMTIDITRREGLDVVRELVRVCDVLIENNAIGRVAAWGLGYEEARQLNPALVYVTMPIYGLSGPYSDYLGFGANGEAISGLFSIRGYEGAGPEWTGQGNHMDATSGIGAAYAAMAALYRRHRTGRGAFVEFAQMEHLVNQIGGPLMDAAMNRRVQTPLGNRDAVRAPQGTYRCLGEDRWVSLSVGADEEWAGLCHAIGRPDLADDQGFQGNMARHRRHDEIDDIIAAWATGRDSRDAMKLLQRHGVPSAMVADDADLHADPHLASRGFFHQIDHPSCGRHAYPGHPYKLSKTPLRFDQPPPLLGEHNGFVYGELLGKADAEIERLTELGHIGTAYAPQLR